MLTFWSKQLSELFAKSRLFRALKDEIGQAMIEIAVTLPLLMLILVGAVEICRVAFASIEVSNAALAAVEYGTQNPVTAADLAGIQTAASNDAPEIPLDPVNVSHSCICSDGTASTCASGDCSSSNIETILTVQTQTTINPGFHLPGLPTTFVLHGQAVQKVLQ